MVLKMNAVNNLPQLSDADYIASIERAGYLVAVSKGWDGYYRATVTAPDRRQTTTAASTPGLAVLEAVTVLDYVS